MSLIENILAREILDSRGNPTVEVEVSTRSNNTAIASVPSGASKGEFECVELRDNDSRFHGMGVSKAVDNVNNIIAPKLRGMEVIDQFKIDHTMLEIDGIENKSVLGGNAILGVSLACLKAGAMDTNLHLFQYVGSKYSENKIEYKIPRPLMNVINGGAHSNNNLDVQEFMLAPKMPTFFRSLRAGSEIFHTLKKLISKKGMSTAVGDEGGFAPNLSSNTEALELILEAIDKSGYIPGENVFLALDVAAGELFKDGVYSWEGQKIKGIELLEVYKNLIKNFPLMSIEDPFYEKDNDCWKQLTKFVDSNCNVVGDDLFATNVKRIKMGVENNLANAVLIKCNQVGTFSETLDAVRLAKKSKFSTIMSHRSGDTEDSLIADLAVGFCCDQIKSGGLCRSERISKYNQLIRIEEMIH